MEEVDGGREEVDGGSAAAHRTDWHRAGQGAICLCFEPPLEECTQPLPMPAPLEG